MDQASAKLQNVLTMQELDWKQKNNKTEKKGSENLDTSNENLTSRSNLNRMETIQLDVQRNGKTGKRTNSHPKFK